MPYLIGVSEIVRYLILTTADAISQSHTSSCSFVNVKDEDDYNYRSNKITQVYVESKRKCCSNAFLKMPLKHIYNVGGS
jgi:hypothetical protein